MRDWLLDSDRAHPPDGAVFSAALLASTGKGRARTDGEIAVLLEEAGFGRVEVVHRGGKDSLLTAVAEPAAPESGGSGRGP